MIEKKRGAIQDLEYYSSVTAVMITTGAAAVRMLPRMVTTQRLLLLLLWGGHTRSHIPYVAPAASYCGEANDHRCYDSDNDDDEEVENAEYNTSQQQESDVASSMENSDPISSPHQFEHTHSVSSSRSASLRNNLYFKN